MMDAYLINEPDVDKWSDHIQDILSGKKDIDLNKLGDAGSYIKNIFLHTEDKHLSKSIKDFFKVYNGLLQQYNQTSYKESTDEILLMLNIANSFRKKDKLKDYELRLYEAGLENTGSLHYFNQLTLLTSNFVEQTAANNLIDNQAILYEYLLYLKKCYITVFADKNAVKNLLPSIKKILNAAVGVNEKLSSLSGFLLYSLDENEEAIAKNPNINKSIIQYCIASKSITNKLLNQLILDFARINHTTFNDILDSFDCSLSSDGFTIVYSDQSYKDLEPGKKEWNYLNELYNLNDTPVAEILQKHLTRPITSNN